MKLMWTVILTLLFVTLSLAKKGGAVSKKDRQKLRFTDRMAELKKSMQCFPFANDEAQYNCAAYLISPSCYSRKFGKGLELGQDDANLKELFYACLVFEGVLGD